MPGIRVYGGSIDNVRGCTDKVNNGDKLSLGADINILCLHTPWYAPITLKILVGSVSQKNQCFSCSNLHSAKVYLVIALIVKS